MIRALEIPGLQGTQVNAPQVSPSAAAAPAAALGSVASAISGVSDTFAGIADRIQRTENARAESETRNTWMLGWSDIQLQLQKEPDPAQHIALTRDWLQQQRGTLDARPHRHDGFFDVGQSSRSPRRGRDAAERKKTPRRRRDRRLPRRAS